MDDIDDLFEPQTGTRNTFYNDCNEEEQAFIDDLVERARKHGRLPVGDRTADEFKRRFGRRPAKDTIRSYVRQALGDG